MRISEAQTEQINGSGRHQSAVSHLTAITYTTWQEMRGNGVSMNITANSIA